MAQIEKAQLGIATMVPSRTFSDDVVRHGPMVYAVCFRILQNHHDAEDATQAAFLILLKKQNSFWARAQRAGWLHHVAVFCAHNVLKMKRRRSRYEGEVGSMKEKIAENLNTATMGSFHLDKALSRLPVRQRDVLVMRYLEGLSQKEIALAMNCSQETVHSRLRMGLQKLRSGLNRMGVSVSELALPAMLTSEPLEGALIEVTGRLQSLEGATTSVSEAVASTTKEVLHSLFWSNMKIWASAAFVAIGVPLLLGVVLFTQFGNAGESLKGENRGKQLRAARSGSFDWALPKWNRVLLRQQSNTDINSDNLYVAEYWREDERILLKVVCRNQPRNKVLWKTKAVELRLLEKEGLQKPSFLREVYLTRDRMLLVGQTQVFAFGRSADQSSVPPFLWEFSYPKGETPEVAQLHGDQLILCGNGHTVALDTRTGKSNWIQQENKVAGEIGRSGRFYAGPYFSKDTICTVRDEPAQVVWRSRSDGQLSKRLKLPGLTREFKDPAIGALRKGIAGAQLKYLIPKMKSRPVGFSKGQLVLTDGTKIYCVDVSLMTLKWSKSLSKLDPSSSPGFRFAFGDNFMFTVKPYYSVLESTVRDLGSGEMLWRRREGGKTQAKKVKGARVDSGATNVILQSAVILNGIAYGFDMGSEKQPKALKGVELSTGKVVLSIAQKEFKNPTAHVEQASGFPDRIWVRVWDQERVECWRVNVKTSKIEKKTIARLTNPSRAVVGWQGPYLILSGDGGWTICSP